MHYRIVFTLVTLFFVAMNVLLWRAEFAAPGRLTSGVTVDSLWRKIVLAQDASSLVIQQDGHRIGYCRWNPTVLQARSQEPIRDEMSIAEMTQAVLGYIIDVDGHFLIDDATRLRFNAALRLDTNFVWQEITARFMLRPDSWEFQVDAASEQVRIRFDDARGQRERVLRFSDFENPERVARRLGAGGLAPLLAGIGIPSARLQATNLLAGINWQARRDRLPVGRAQIPVTRVQAAWFNRLQATAYVSTFGEIFRVELPGNVVLVTDAINAP
jgi:hypothetical protein